MKQTASRAGATHPFLTSADEALLRSLNDHHYLTLRQLTRSIGYSPHSVNYVQGRIKRLADGSFATRHFLPKPTPIGKAPTIYGLGTKGRRHLTHLGVPVPARLRHSEAPHAYLFYLHTLQVNDVLIAAAEVSRHHPGVRLEAVVHERVLKRSPVAVTLADRTTMTVIPDAWLDFRIRDATGTFRACVVLELDRGTEGKQAYRRKCAGLIAYANGPYQQAFGTDSLTIAVVTTGGERRQRDLLAWTEAAFAEARTPVDGALFCFTHCSFSDADAYRHFLTPCWQRPFGTGPVSVLPVGEVFP